MRTFAFVLFDTSIPERENTDAFLPLLYFPDSRFLLLVLVTLLPVSSKKKKLYCQWYHSLVSPQSSSSLVCFRASVGLLLLALLIFDKVF